MDNSNNSFEKREGKSAFPSAVDGQKERPFSQGKYPQPPEWTKNIVVSSAPWPTPDEKGNVSVKLNESEKEEQENPVSDEKPDAEEAPEKEWPMWMQIGVIALMVIVVILVAMNAFRSREAPDEPYESVQQTDASTVTSAVSPSVTVVHTPDEAPSSAQEDTTTAPEEGKTTVDSGEKPASPSADGKQNVSKDKNKIVEYFNQSSNRVKTEAKSVVKNFENRTHNEDKLILPSAIRGVAKSLLESKITDITEPELYPYHEAIIAMYPVQGQEWSSKLTADDVAEATCVEKDGADEITLVLKSCVDPEPEKGASRALDCLDVPTVRDTAPPFVTAFSAEYYDCVIRCRVDKSTGRVIWSNYTTPVVIKIGFDAGFVKFDAEIGLTFEKDYTITY